MLEIKDKQSYLLLIVAAIEVIACTLLLKYKFLGLASVAYFVAGIGIAIVPMLKLNSAEFDDKPKIPYYVYCLAIAAVLVFYFINASKVINRTNIDPVFADMLPVLKTMATRYVNSEAVYAPIQELWGGFLPKYLPALWMSFVPAILLEIDIRWMTVVFLCCGLIIAFIKSDYRRQRPLTLVIAPLLFVVCWYIARFDPNFISLTQEGVIVGLYLFLGFTLFTKNYWLQGLAICLCILSRYSFTFWVPMYVAFVFFFQNRKAAIQLVVSVAVCSVLLLLASGAYKELDTFSSLQGNYLTRIQDPGNKPHYLPVIQSGLGIARFFAYEKLKWLHYMMLGVALTVPFASLLILWWKKNKLNMEFFAVCSLKLSLVFFYNLLTLPYLYLFYTSTFFTFIILYRFINRNIETHE